MADLDQENQGPGDNAVTNLQVKVDKLSSLMERFMTRPEPVVQQNTGASSVALGPTNVFIPPATLGQAIPSASNLQPPMQFATPGAQGCVTTIIPPQFGTLRMML